jgi:hypothetical protein
VRVVRAMVRMAVFVRALLAASMMSPGELHHRPSAVTCAYATTARRRRPHPRTTEL